MKTQSFQSLCITLLATGSLLSFSARAGVFNIPHFVAPGEFAIGFEPELRVNQGSGLGANIKYTQGINDLVNAQAIIGDSSSSRGFRAGGNVSFDFFPDTGDQPGLGIAPQAIFYHLVNSPDLGSGGDVEVTAIPYIHKTFAVDGGEIDPFVAVPIGWDFAAGGQYHAKTTVAFGSQFKNTDHLRFTAEAGIDVSNAQSYISGGVTYYH